MHGWLTPQEIPRDFRGLLSMKKPVLLVIDMLNDFLGDWDSTRRRGLVRAINDLIAIMRNASQPVIWVRQEFEPDLSDAFLEMKTRKISITVKGTAGCQIVSELAVAASDQIILKKRYSAFFRTSLDEELARLQPDAIILAGINTHACIRTTAIDAYQRDWPVVLASECIDSYDREHHEVSMKYMSGKIAMVMSNEEIRLALAED